MNYKLLPALALCIATLSSCGGGSKSDSGDVAPETNQTEPKTETCTYSHSETTPEVMWVAYKYTEKTGVKGTFEEAQVSNTGSGSSISDVLNGAQIKINTSSSNSGDPTRDPKIKESFFGKLANGQEITGSITSVNGTEEEGQVEASLTMNGETEAAKGKYTVKDNQLEMKFELDVNTWSAASALEALNKVCEDLHKGADGKSILWPDVTVFVTTTLDKACE